MRFEHLPAVIQSVVRFMLHDEVRIFEVFSTVNLWAWSVMLWISPDVVDASAYQGFTRPPQMWGAITALVGTAQALAMILRHMGIARLRFPAMAAAAGVWTAIACQFWLGPASTASFNYTLIAVGCAVSGVYLGWKPTSNNC